MQNFSHGGQEKEEKEDPNMKIGQDYSNFGERFWAIDGINLEINKGEAVGVIGGNGAGKSTLLRFCRGLLHQQKEIFGLEVEYLRCWKLELDFTVN